MDFPLCSAVATLHSDSPGSFEIVEAHTVFYAVERTRKFPRVCVPVGINSFNLLDFPLCSAVATLHRDLAFPSPGSFEIVKAHTVFYPVEIQEKIPPPSPRHMQLQLVELSSVLCSSHKKF